jgi:hypothetical protein
MQWDEMIPFIPNLVHENNKRDQKNDNSEQIALQNLVNKRKKDAIYVRNDYEHHFPQMGEILELF